MSDGRLPHNRYLVVGDFGSNYGWVIDWDRYEKYHWWQRWWGTAKKECTVAAGTRQQMSELAHELNLAELKKNNPESK